MLVDMFKWPQVGPSQWRNVWRPILPLGLASASDHQKAVFRLGRKIYFLGESACIVIFPSGASSTSDIGKGSAPRSLLLVRNRINPSLLH